MGLMDLIVKGMQEANPDVEIKRMNNGSHVIETAAQAKYNDIRKTERNYTSGKGRAIKQTLK